VLDQVEVQQTQWYKDVPQTLEQKLRRDRASPMERLRDTLSAQPRPRTEIIDVVFTADSAADARLIVDAVLKQYVQYIGEKSDATEDAIYRQLLEQYNSLQSQIRGGEATHAELCRALGTNTPQELITARRIRMDETQARLNELRTRIAVLEWEQKAAGGDGNDVSAGATARSASQPRYHADPEWCRLDLDVKSTEQQIADSTYLPSHPEGMRLLKNLHFARDLLRRRQTQLDEQWGDRLRMAGTLTAIHDPNSPGGEEGSMSTERQLARAKLEQQLLAADLEKQQTEFKPLFESAQLLEKESNALRYKREFFEAVRQRLDQKNIERNVPGSIEVSMWALSSSRPAGDRRKVFTAVALALGLGMGGGVAFVRASRSQVIYAAKDIPQPVQVPFLGHIPLIPEKEPLRMLLCDEAQLPQSFLVESIRVVRTALLARLGDQAGATALITSSTAGTGKTSFTMVLGRYLARAGKKVLLIDADFCRTTLSRLCNASCAAGFLDALSSRSVEEQHIFATDTPDLHVMPTGTNGDAACEKIANGAFKVCMDQLLRQYGYDIILLDGAPILPVADATILTSQVDGAILVERERVSRREDLANALIRITSIGGRLLGAVFVGSDGHGDYRHRYSHQRARG
jgi:capsular exopolysaccharide synthesis family protein